MVGESSDFQAPGRRRDGVTGVVLAGGRSLRYGTNKALERVGGVRLIELVIQALRPVLPEIILITNTPSDFGFLGLPMYKDRIPNLGPLGGIHTGLYFMPSPVGFFVACDMPFLNTSLIGYMVSLRHDADAVVPRVSGLLEPLHAVYTNACAPAVEECVARGERRIGSFYPMVKVRYVEEAEIRRFDPRLGLLTNVNRPEDLPETEAG